VLPETDVQAVRELTRGRGAHLCLEASSSPQARVEAVRCVRTWGKVCYVGEGDTVAVAKELADLLYVVYGTAVSCGIDMEPVFREVHRSNMSKVGGHKREDGKWVKPSTYSPARLELILVAQSSKEGA